MDWIDSGFITGAADESAGFNRRLNGFEKDGEGTDSGCEMALIAVV